VILECPACERNVTVDEKALDGSVVVVCGSCGEECYVRSYVRHYLTGTAYGARTPNPDEARDRAKP
jgi:predicted RNA-binding Zn-ribbon protein involved in translation (DUF1610 family)